MAKSLEDTFFYRYVRLLALNEVGGDPAVISASPWRRSTGPTAASQAWPYRLIATASHDTKRGEDARARIGALSEMPDAGRRRSNGWRELCGAAPDSSRGGDAPDRTTGTWSCSRCSAPGRWSSSTSRARRRARGFRQRVDDFAAKALREAKRHTSWVNPDETYEACDPLARRQGARAQRPRASCDSGRSPGGSRSSAR